MTEPEPTEDGNRKSFWLTLPGILTGLSGLVTAIVAAASLFIIDDSDEKAGGNGTPTHVSSRDEPDGKSRNDPSKADVSSAGPGTGSRGDGNNSQGGGERPDFRVVDATAAADPADGQVSCPVTITFTGRIAVDGGSGDVSYRWIGSDETTPEEGTVTVGESAPGEVTTTLTLGESGGTVEGWRELEIVTPGGPDSNRAEFQLSCE
ncbi:MAG: hypothetical protein M3141_03425 [Actinomycetota bacterium]|nr:hypothetical protein [Actinomycetota bacterium]